MVLTLLIRVCNPESTNIHLHKLPNYKGGEVQLMVTDGSVELEKYMVQVQGFRQMDNCFKRICKIYLHISQGKLEGWTWKHLDLDQFGQNLLPKCCQIILAYFTDFDSTIWRFQLSLLTLWIKADLLAVASCGIIGCSSVTKWIAL